VGRLDVRLEDPQAEAGALLHRRRGDAGQRERLGGAHRAGQEVASSEACVPHESSSCIRGVALRWGECGRVSAAGRDAVKGVRRLSVLFGTLPQSARLLLCELPDLRQMLLHLGATQQISYELFSLTLSFVPPEKRLGHILSGRLGTDALDSAVGQLQERLSLLAPKPQFWWKISSLHLHLTL